MALRPLSGFGSEIGLQGRQIVEVEFDNAVNGDLIVGAGTSCDAAPQDQALLIAPYSLKRRR